MWLGTTATNGWPLTAAAARAYEQHVVARLHGPWARELVTLAELEKGERALDVACGTGAVARLVAQKLGPNAVIGVDGNPQMLPFEDAAFDVVFCQQGVQFFSDRLGGLREMYRVLAPGGRVLLAVCTSLDRNPYILALAETLAAHVSQEAAQIMTGVCSLGSRDELANLLRAGGFDDVTIQRERKPAHFPLPEKFLFQHLAALPIAEAVDRLTPDAKAALVDEMSTRVRGYVGTAGLSVPFEVHLGRARRSR